MQTDRVLWEKQFIVILMDQTVIMALWFNLNYMLIFMGNSRLHRNVHYIINNDLAACIIYLSECASARTCVCGCACVCVCMWLCVCATDWVWLFVCVSKSVVWLILLGMLFGSAKTELIPPSQLIYSYITQASLWRKSILHSLTVSPVHPSVTTYHTQMRPNDFV